MFPRVPGTDPTVQAHASHDLQHARGGHPHTELVEEAHVDLPVPAPVRAPMPDLVDQRFEIRSGDVFGMRPLIEVGGPRQPGDPQEDSKPVSPPGHAKPLLGFYPGS